MVAAADAPAVFAEQYPNSSTLLLVVRREELLEPDLPEEIGSEIKALEARLISLMIRLALRVWERKDAGPSTPSPRASSTCPPRFCCAETGWAAVQHASNSAPP